MLTFFLYFTMSLFIIVCLFMILLVLIQKGRGGGLASAFGGAGGNTAFGSKTGDVLTWATSVVFGVFLILAIVLNLLANTYHTRRVGPPPITMTSSPGSGSATGTQDDSSTVLPSTRPTTNPSNQP